jgi:peroxiredoxin
MEHTLPLPGLSARPAGESDRLNQVFLARDQQGRSIGALSHEQPVLLVFLRHLGCTFCREAATDVSEQRKAIEREGVMPAFVGMMEEPELGEFLDLYGLGDLPRFADPTRSLYRAFGLGRGSAGQLIGPRVWRRGLAAAAPSWLGGGGHGVGALKGDGLQMPGVFLLHEERVIGGYRHETAADRPNYSRLACEVK